MYITNNSLKKPDTFDWDVFFRSESAEVDGQKAQAILLRAREHLQENLYQFSLSFTDVMKRLMSNQKLQSPSILELGAGTGYLTRWLLERYGGKGTLVDNNVTAFEKYLQIQDPITQHIEYQLADFNQFRDDKRYDIVCSFGVLEHFSDKTELLALHKKFVKNGGHLIILVPMDTPLTRIYYEVFPELNLGYRELLTKAEMECALSNSGITNTKFVKSSHYRYDFLASISCYREENA